MKTPGDYISKKIKADLSKLPVTVVNKDIDEKIVYCQRYEPTELGGEEHRKYHLSGAGAYELYIICSDNKIEDINYRIEQLQCSHHSYAPHGAPAWIFPEGAMFDIEWDDIVPLVRKDMLNLLNAFVGITTKPKKKIVKEKAQKKTGTKQTSKAPQKNYRKHARQID